MRRLEMVPRVCTQARPGLAVLPILGANPTECAEPATDNHDLITVRLQIDTKPRIYGPPIQDYGQLRTTNWNLPRHYHQCAPFH
jgi:hypothetical protein